MEPLSSDCGKTILVKHIYACWDAKDPNSNQIIERLPALPDIWLKQRKNHWERCTFTPPVVPHHIFDAKKNLYLCANIASFGVFEYCFDAFDSYSNDVSGIMSEYGYFEKSDDVAAIDRFFGIPFKDMIDWPSEK